MIVFGVALATPVCIFRSESLHSIALYIVRIFFSFQQNGLQSLFAFFNQVE